jgi:hypothetical protein
MWANHKVDTALVTDTFLSQFFLSECIEEATEDDNSDREQQRDKKEKEHDLRNKEVATPESVVVLHTSTAIH